MVIAIEPMFNLGTGQVSVDRDGWTVRTGDRSPSAHFEYTIAIGVDGPVILGLGRLPVTVAREAAAVPA
jgi:methionyl aminopeptidase